MVNLADCYAIGNGVRRNDKKAFTLYQQAAEKNNIDGIRNLADSYYNSIGTKQDFKEALKLYQRAADMGDNTSKERLEKLQAKLNPQRHEISTGEISDAAKAVKKPTLADKLKMGADILKSNDADKDKQADKSSQSQEQAAQQNTEQQSR